MLFQTLGPPHVTQHVGNQNNPSFWPLRNFPPSQTFLFHFGLVTSRRRKKDTKKTYPNPKREIAQRWLSVSACLKKVFGRAGGGKFFYWKHGQNWRSNIIKYCANSTKSDTFQPHQLLLQLPRNTPVSAYKLYSSCSYSILSCSSLSYSTLPLCIFHFQVMIFKSLEPKSFSTKLRLRIQKMNRKEL